jgi:pyruvate kinase
MDDFVLTPVALRALSVVRELLRCECHPVDLPGVAPLRYPSALNLVATLHIRSVDRQTLLKDLHELCLDFPSDIATVSTLVKLEQVLSALACVDRETFPLPKYISHLDARSLVIHNREALYGPIESRYTAIVVTLDPPAMSLSLMKDLIRAGMNCARINTAHDTPEQWEHTVALLRQAERELGNTKPLMVHWDLAGPKLRTLPVANAGVQVMKLAVRFCDIGFQSKERHSSKLTSKFSLLR